MRDQLKASKAHALQREADTSQLIKACMAQGNKARAMLLLKMVKMFRARVDACEGKLANVEQVLDSFTDAQALRQQVCERVCVCGGGGGGL